LAVVFKYFADREDVDVVGIRIPAKGLFEQVLGTHQSLAVLSSKMPMNTY
jgi:hypothetical protein